LSKREKKELLEELEKLYELKFNDEVPVEVVIDEGVELYLFEGEPAFVRIGGSLLPHLKFLLKHGHCFLPKVLVDRGASGPVGRGADVMAPGVRGVVGSFQASSIVVVVDEPTGLPVAVGSALVSSADVAQIKRGKVVKNLHHYGDAAWKLAEKLLK